MVGGFLTNGLKSDHDRGRDFAKRAMLISGDADEVLGFARKNAIVKGKPPEWLAGVQAGIDEFNEKTEGLEDD